MEEEKTFKGLPLGQLSSTKENFTFSLPTGELFVRHSEYAIKKVVKDLMLQYAFISRDKNYWTVFQCLTQSWIYTPKY